VVAILDFQSQDLGLKAVKQQYFWWALLELLDPLLFISGTWHQTNYIVRILSNKEFYLLLHFSSYS